MIDLASQGAMIFGGTSNDFGSIDVPIPAGSAVGDVLILALCHSNNIMYGVPTGWILASEIDLIKLAYRVVTGSEGPSVNCGTYNFSRGWIGRFTGVDTSSVLDVPAVSDNSVYSATPPSIELITVTDGDYIFQMIGKHWGATFSSYPAIYDGIANAGTASSAFLAMAGKVQSTAGNTGSANWTLNTDGYPRIGIALRPYLTNIFLPSRAGSNNILIGGGF